jgi:hypothetical protein
LSSNGVTLSRFEIHHKEHDLVPILFFHHTYRFPKGGKHVLHIPASLWTILQQNRRFEGIRPTPNPKPNPDGSYTVKLSTIQWKVFQENQKKPPVPVPGEPAPEKPVPVKEPEKPEEKPDDKPEEEITVIQEPSTF